MRLREIWEMELSKNGLACMWECGGGFTNTGRATVICGPEGQRKKPIYIRRSGTLACGNHALIPVELGDVVIDAEHSHGDFLINVWRIMSIDRKERTVGLNLISHFSAGEWDRGKKHLDYEEAIEAVMKKAQTYHCREPFFIEK